MRYTRSQLIIVPFLLVIDILSVIISVYLAYKLRFFSVITDYFPVTKGFPEWIIYKNTLYLSIPLFIFIFFQNDFYRSYFPSLLDELVRIIKGVSVGIFFLVLATFFYREFTFSRITFVLFWFLLILAIFIVREIFKVAAVVSLRSFFGRENILIVGKNNAMIKAILKQHPNFRVYYAPIAGENNISKIKNIITKKNISQVVLLHYNWAEYTLMSFYDWCENLKIDLKFIPTIVQLCRGELKIDSSLGLPMFHLNAISFSGFNFYFKRVMDIIISSTVIIILSPLLIAVAAIIKIDSKGPVLYKHKRMGYRGREFDFYKFRTMVSDADKLLESFKGKSERKGPVFKMSKDPRITRFGKIIRRYSIDELPQLLNVLKGDMSLVGPRPQVLWEAAAYDDWAKRRLRVLPGITGLWQVSGRASLSYEEMIELDIFYIENWSPGLDLKILFKTLPAIIGQKGAY
ncbi:MAG: sugar transferase [Elusimicrobia bacterium]|nr:sugar transferase [Elusimicrobiota bacterium]